MPELLLTPLLVALIQGAGSAIASHSLNAPRWWQGIHLAFGPLLYVAHAANLPPWIWPVALTISVGIFWRTDTSRVPLYLSNEATARALARLLPSHPTYVLDAGCGDGGLLRRVARLRPECEFVGIEHAPATFLWARLRAGHLQNLEIRYGNFWQTPFTPYDVVYAFLSPVPMTDLWRKASSEMRPGTLLVSNSFSIEDVQPQQEIAVQDSRQTSPPYLSNSGPGWTVCRITGAIALHFPPSTWV